MRSFILSLAIVFAGNFSFAQSADNSPWNKDVAEHLSFIENRGQYEGRDWGKFGNIHYAYAQNPYYIFFTEKGLAYRFDRIIKNPAFKGEEPWENDEEKEGEERYEGENYESETISEYGASEGPKRTNISELVFVEWVNANSDIEIISEEKVDYYYSFAMKDEVNKIYNIGEVPAYRMITYKNVYDNIDFQYTIHPEGGVKFNVILHPGADPSQIQLKYSSNTTDVAEESVFIELNNKGQLAIETSLGEIIEHKPETYYQDSKIAIHSSYAFNNNTLTFDIDNYDPSKTVVIDPWIVSPTFNTSTAVWEVETDGAGNVYTIGGETPMELWKYNSTGTLQWTYVTPWDTSTVWLGTLATDFSGNSYVTSGVTAEMHKVDNAGNFIWQTAPSGGLQYNSEWWSITFNCDETKLITGGTWVMGIFSFDFYAGIFEIDVATGAVLSDQTVDQTNIGAFGATPVEVRSISSSKNSKFIYLTHKDVGAINENFGSCPNELPIFQVDNGHNLGYKCENYLPATQNGGGLKALVANDNFIYSHSGDKIWQRNVTDGTLVNSVNLPGGGSTGGLFGTVVHCSGLDVDDCGNVYAGSTNQVVKFDANLNILGSSATTFTVYDVSVNSNGEVLACGAQQDNSQTNRNGRIEAISMSACSQYALVCCDANFCNPGYLCVNSAPVSLSPSTPGGTWSGTGVNASGVFDPAIAGVGTTLITYTLACGSNEVSITVLPCDLTICEETNGDLSASGGNGSYTWYEQTITPVNQFITSETECIACPTANPVYLFGNYLYCDNLICTLNDTTWAQYATGTTTSAPSSYPIMVEDGNGESVIIYNASQLVPCTACNITPTASMISNPSGCGVLDGVIEVCGLDPSTLYDDLSYDDGSGTVSLGSFTTDGSGCYQITGLGADSYSNFVVTQGVCTGSDAGPITLTDPAGPTPTASLVSNPTGCGATDGIIQICGLTASTSYNNLDYTDGSGTVTVGSFTTDGSGCYQITGLGADSYSNFVVTLSGCTGTDAGPIALTDPAGPTPTASFVSNPTGCGATDGVIQVCGLTPATTYDNLDYTDGSGTVTVGSFTTDGSGCYQITGLGADSYSNFVVTLSGCTGTDAGPIALTDPAGPTPTASLVSNPTGCGATDGVIQICGLSTSTTYDNLDYTDGSGTVTVGSFTTDGSGCYQITGLGADSYSNFIVTLAGCNGSDAGPIALSDPGSPTPSAALVSDPTGCGVADGVIQICGLTPSTTYDNLDYTDGSGTVNVGSFTTDGSGCYQITGLSADSYSSFIVTLSGCTGSDAGPVALTDPAGPVPTASLVSNPSGCGAADGIIQICGLTPSTTYNNLDYDNGSGTVNVGSFTTDGSGCYQITGLSADSYSNFVVTLSGCSGSDAGPIALSDPGGPAPIASIVSDPTGCGATDGIIQICGLTPSTTYDNLDYDNGSGTVNVGSFTTDGTGCYQITGLGADNFSNFVVTLAGCTGSDAGPVTLNDPGSPAPSASVVSNPSGCGLTDGIIQICGLTPSTTYDNLSYDDGSGTVTIGSFTTDGSGCYQITGLGADSYSNFVVTLAGCSGTDAGPLSLSAAGGPTVTITSSSDVSCFGGNDGMAVASASGGTAPYSYSWSPSGGMADTASNLTVGTYTVTVTDNAGCTGTATVTINEPTAIVITETITDEDCGQSNGAVSLSVSGGTSGYSYNWTPNGETTSSITNVGNGTYGVTVTDGNGCTATGSYTVGSVGGIAVTATPQSQTITSGQSVQLFATGADSYVWTPADGLDCSTCANPTASPTITTTYIVVGTDANGCTGSDTVTIYVNIECGDIFVPDVFSPNGDLNNDKLCVYGNCIAEFKYSIYNRWGQLIFETEDPTVCWDGTYKGKEEISGTYAYKLYVMLTSGEVLEQSGNVTLTR